MQFWERSKHQSCPQIMKCTHVRGTISYACSVNTNAVLHRHGFMTSKPHQNQCGLEKLCQNHCGLEVFTRNHLARKSKSWWYKWALHYVLLKFTILNQTMQISRQKVTVFKLMRFRCLHDGWNRIVLKTLPFWQRFQIDPVSPTVSIGIVWTNRRRNHIEFDEVTIETAFL